MANGNFAGGHGTELNPYLIEDAFDLDAIRNDLTAYYKLTRDIDLDITPFNEGKGWVPINNFSGKLDGNGYTLHKLYLDNTKNNTGFFGFCDKSFKITDMRFVDAQARIKTNSGILIGYVNSSPKIYVDNCYIQGKLLYTSDMYGMGGVVGTVWTGSVTITNCYFDIDWSDIISTHHNRSIGIIVGVRYGKDNVFCKNVYYLPRDLKLPSDTISMHDNNPKYVNYFYNKELAGRDIISPNAKTTMEMLSLSTYMNAGWNLELTDDSTPVWMLEDGQYPKLWFEVKEPCLIKSNSIYYSYQNKEFIEVEPTEENFKEYSINLIEVLIPDSDGVKPLMALDNPEIMVLTDKENSKLHIQGFRDLRPLMESSDPKILINSEVKPEINVAFLPEPQLIIPTGDIVLKMLDKIYEFTIHSNKNHGGIIKIVFSVDSGISWMTYNIVTEEFEEINIGRIEDVKEDGIDPDVFNVIGEKWNQIIVNNKIRFAYYLEINSMNDIANVDKLEIKMDMHGRWKKAVCDDYSYEYDNEHIYINFFKDGSYKINYQE